jgi:hypothetical protein
MIKHGIRLLVTLALTTAAVTAGWTHASSDSRFAPGDASTLSMRTPAMTPYSGEPDPGAAPIPKLISSRDQDRYSSRPTLTWSWVSRVWAMWILRSAR